MLHSLNIIEIVKTFKGRSVLDYVSFECKTGEILGIFGSNGSGKSTILKILLGEVKANSLFVKLNNTSLSAKDIIPKKIIAYLPQYTFLPKGMKVKNIIPLYYKGNEQDKIFYAKGVHQMTNLRASELSMGQLRYLEILLVCNLPHPFIILDEPFSMIEPLYKEYIKEFLFSIKNNKGIILTDHYYYYVLDISNKNVVLKNGRTYPISNKNELQHFGYLPNN